MSSSSIHASRVRRRYSVHGLGVELLAGVPALDDAIDGWLWPFVADVLPQGPACTYGVVQPYDSADVSRRVSARAVRLATPGHEALELYQEGERFWLVDERWGLCEINVMKGMWRSWVLPRMTPDAARVAEMAVLWPMAQLLRSKGLYLIPSASVARGDFGVMLMAPFNLEGELRALVRAGYEIVGQRWTAVREQGGRIQMLQVPGRLEREVSLRLREEPVAGSGGAGIGAGAGASYDSRWVDLTSEYCGVIRHSAFCDAIVVVERGRRPTAHVTRVAGQRAADQLRRAWPITELHPWRRHGQLLAKLAQLCECYQAQFSRRADDLLVLLESVRSPRRIRPVMALPSEGLSAPAAGVAGSALREAV